MKCIACELHTDCMQLRIPQSISMLSAEISRYSWLSSLRTIKGEEASERRAFRDTRVQIKQSYVFNSSGYGNVRAASGD